MLLTLSPYSPPSGPLHVASWIFSQHGCWAPSRRKWKEHTETHFHCILLAKAVLGPAQNQGSRKIDMPLSIGSDIFLIIFDLPHWHRTLGK